MRSPHPRASYPSQVTFLKTYILGLFLFFHLKGLFFHIIYFETGLGFFFLPQPRNYLQLIPAGKGEKKNLRRTFKVETKLI